MYLLFFVSFIEAKFRTSFVESAPRRTERSANWTGECGCVCIFGTAVYDENTITYIAVVGHGNVNSPNNSNAAGFLLYN